MSRNLISRGKGGEIKYVMIKFLILTRKINQSIFQMFDNIQLVCYCSKLSSHHSRELQIKSANTDLNDTSMVCQKNSYQCRPTMLEHKTPLERSPV